MHLEYTLIYYMQELISATMLDCRIRFDTLKFPKLRFLSFLLYSDLEDGGSG